MPSSLGLLLFSSVVIVSVASYHLRDASFRGTMAGRSLHLHSRRTLPSAFDSALAQGPTRLIRRNSPEYLDGSWSQIVSETPSAGTREELECELVVVNRSERTIILCWISESGKLHNFYPIDGGSIQDGSVSMEHCEFTYTGHAFVCFLPHRENPSRLSEIDSDKFVFICQLCQGSLQHRLVLGPSNEVDFPVNVATLPIAGDVIDTSQKKYQQCNNHGFCIHYEPGVFESVSSLENCLSLDLGMVCKLIPSQVLTRLQKSTVFWINKSITFGPVTEPIEGDCCTYHPRNGQNWLRKMGKNLEKSGSIEIYNAERYLESRTLWGIGGLLLHELMHAYHDQYVSGGFENVDVCNAFTLAMDRKLYDAVGMHTRNPDKPFEVKKGYCCTNCMEFFAELSVAYLWDMDQTIEYNKWFPHNKWQLEQHDIDSFRVLNTIWGKYKPRAAPAHSVSYL